VYDGSQMLFYTGNTKGGSASNTTHSISITNTFNVTVVVYNIALSSTSRDMFSVSMIATNVSITCEFCFKLCYWLWRRLTVYLITTVLLLLWLNSPELLRWTCKMYLKLTGECFYRQDA